MRSNADTSVVTIAEVYDEYAAGLFRYARALLDSDDDAEDAVCEVFLQLVHDEKRLERLRDVKSYLLRATRNAAYRIFRDARRRDNLAKNTGLEISLGAHDESNEDLDSILAEFAALTCEQRDVLALKILHELTFKEIGEIIGVSQNTIASRYRYGIERLRKAVKESKHEIRAD